MRRTITAVTSAAVPMRTSSFWHDRCRTSRSDRHRHGAVPFMSATERSSIQGVRAMKYVDQMRMNHLEVTIARGSVAGIRDSLVAFYGDVLGFGVNSIEAFGPAHMFLTRDIEGSQFLYVAEHDQPMIVGGDDHLGFHVDSPATVDALLAECRAVQERDPRMQIRELE